MTCKCPNCVLQRIRTSAALRFGGVVFSLPRDERFANEKKLRAEIAAAINRCSAENGSNTPDFILAEYLANCLTAFDAATARREKWYGYTLSIGRCGPDAGDSHTETEIRCGGRESAPQQEKGN